MRLSLSLCLLAMSLVALPRQATAQAPTTSTQTTVSSATELDPDDPRAKRASAFVTLLLAKDTADARKYLKTHAVPGSPAATDIEKQVTELHTALAAGFVVSRVAGGNDDSVLVSLASKDGERGGRMGVRLQIERDSPHRIREVKPVTPRRQVIGGN